jgi:hypothetical protein
MRLGVAAVVREVTLFAGALFAGAFFAGALSAVVVLGVVTGAV